jgi:hypothetical protein
MSKIMSIHTLEALPGANREDFEKVMLEAASTDPMVNAEGWKTYIVKGDRGARKGQFALIHEFDSVEARNRYFPTENGEPAEEAQQVLRSFEASGLANRWNALVKDGDYTDYVFVGE